ncbi:MAG: SIMPL domain-containing protein [Candidatus Planktophila sp.]
MKMTKKLISIPVVALVAATAFALPASAATPERYITVNAEGIVQVTPDAVRLNAIVSIIGATSAEALSKTSAAATKVRNAIKAKSIATKDVKTTSISVYPEYNYTQDKGSVQIGYRATQSFEVIIRNATSAGAVVDDVVAAGGDSVQIQGATPFVLDSAKATASARTAAVANAKAKASSYAKLLGVKLGKVTYLVENSSPVSYPTYTPVAKAADSMATEIDLGKQDVTVSITVRWSLA